MHNTKLTQEQINYLRSLVTETQSSGIDQKLKPFTCKRCHAVLGFTTGKIFKSGLMVINQAQSIVIRCEKCGTSRDWKPCKSKV